MATCDAVISPAARCLLSCPVNLSHSNTMNSDADFNVEFLPDFFTTEDSDRFFKELKNINFFTPTFKINRRNVQPKRKIAGFGDDGLSYSFSGCTVPALPWTPLLLEIRDYIEKYTGCAYNFVLLNQYADGTDYLSQHKEDEHCVDNTFPLAVASFGETRTLDFKRPFYKTESFTLFHGSLYIVKKPTNDVYTHGIAPDYSKKGMRISLSFRHIIDSPNNKRLKVLDKSEPAFNDEPASVPTRWDLDADTYVTVQCENTGVKLYIRDAEHRRPIVMNSLTWLDLSEKLIFFNFKDALICNQQLLVAPTKDGRMLLQQMFKTHVSTFYLTPHVIRLTKHQILELRDYSIQINDTLIHFQLTKLFPDLIIKNSGKCITHFETEVEAEEFFLQCFLNEVKSSLNTLYPCMGCDFNDDSQFNHECMTLCFKEKFPTFKQKVLSTLNVFKIVKHLSEKCVCYYTLDSFVNKLNMQYFEYHLEKCH